jgi:hypothetical protein
MGCESKWIGVAKLLEFCGVSPRELFAFVEHRGERDDAGDEVAGVSRVCEMWRATPARRFRADSCDLAAAHRDPEAQAVLDIEDEKLELQAQRGIEEELAERFWISRDVRELRHALAQHLGPLAKRIAGKQGAQDDPDQLHGSQCSVTADPG